jgi:uncharacterized RDD family membrane protein YckC
MLSHDTIQDAVIHIKGGLDILNDSIKENNIITGHHHAGFWIRVGAYLIDCIVVGIAQFAIGTLINLIVKGELLVSSNNNSFYFSIIYYVVLTKSYGQTLGKKWLGIQVIRTDGKPLTYWGVFLREIILKTVSGLILGIGYFMVAFRKDKHALHDLAAKTIVVYK